MSGELSLHATTPREPMARKTPISGLPTGASIAGYTVVAPLGNGGMGRVYVAEDEKLERKVALKILPPEDADDEGRARFLREAQALARVRHKNVVQVFASGVDEDVAWMALEYVVGDPLGVLAGAVDEETALSLCAQAARGLAAVHEVGVVHRDVKPDNLLVDENACLRVLDFGVALFVETGSLSSRGGFVTQKGVAVGTPHFMAPEQARGGTIDARADAWGLGATLFSLLAGRPPFYARDDEPDLDILARVLRERAPDIRTLKSVSAPTAALLAKMLEPDLDKRIADMATIAEACDEIADGLASGAITVEPSTLERSSLPSSTSASAALSLTPEPSTARQAGTPAPPSGPGATAAPTGPSTSAGAGAPSTSASAPSTSANAAGVAPRGPSTSALRMVALAASFAALGAVVAFEVAGSVGGPAVPVPAVPEEHASSVALGTGAVSGGANSANGAGTVASTAGNVATGANAAGNGAKGAGNDASANGAVDVDTVNPPALPSVDELEAAIVGDPDGHRAELKALVARGDNDARAGVVRLAAASGPVGDDTLDAIASEHALQHMGAIEKALFDGNRARAAHAIDVLVAMRPFEALEVLERASTSHKDKATRAKALAAREALFHVEGQ